MDWHSKAIELSQQNLNNKEISDYLRQIGFNLDVDEYKAYERVRAYIKGKNKKLKVTVSDVPTKKTYIFKDGVGTYEETLQIIDGREITPKIIMEAHNLKPDEWDVVSFCSNVWQQQTKEGNTIDLCQSKLSVKPKKDNKVTFEDIEKYFAKKDFNKKIPLKPFPYKIDGEVLEIAITDLHKGLLTWNEETGSDYDIKIARQRLLETIADVIKRCKGRKFKKIILVTLGDILHVDNDKQETTNGTFQQVENRIAKIFNMALDMFIDILNALLELESPIEFVYLCGNHDRNTGYFLVKALQMAFKNNPNITFDISPNPQKAKVIGNTLVGFCHGDMPKKNLGEWLQKEYRKEYGQTRFAEVHCGHLHSESVKENCGVLIKHLPALCESSYWEHQQGYTSDRGLMCFVWNEDTGLRETWYYYI